MNRISYAVVVFFAGAAIVFGVVIFVYAVATMFDRLSCFNTSSDMLTPQEHEERRVASDLTRRSGLAGMLSSERSRVFRAFFEKRALAYHKTNKGGGDDIEAQKKQTDKTSSTDENKSDVDNRKSGEEAANKQEGSSESKEEVDGQAHNTTDATCPICLNEYDEGEKVITGTSCSHMFHYECCMQWLEKGNEHCPYCRVDMMTAEELYEAAREELGGDRVEKLKRVNVEAARRIAEYQASLIQSNANSTHNRLGVDQATRVVVPTTSAERHTEEPRAEISAVEETSMNPITSSEESVEAPDDIGTGDADETTSSEGMEDGVEAEGTTTENLDTRN